LPQPDECDENYCELALVGADELLAEAGRLIGIGHQAWNIALSPLSLRIGEHEQEESSVTALQDWLNIRPFDPRNHVKAVVCALRGATSRDNGDTADLGEAADRAAGGVNDAADTTATAEPALLPRGLERC